MPTRNQIRKATPRCPGHKLKAGVWEDCGRLLIWKHSHGVWACAVHGWVSEPEAAEPVSA